MTVKVLKLISGDEVLGDVEITIDGYTLTDPVGISVVRMPDGNPGVGFTPFPMHRVSDPSAAPTKGYTLDIPAQSVVYSYVPAQDFLDNYDQIFGAGIILPNKQIITG